jgi:two-component system phosphate regulon sensor histidine kinase PhoR
MCLGYHRPESMVRSRPPTSRLPVLFAAALCIPVAALAWLASELVERDRRLERQQVQDRLERAADRIVASSHQRLVDLEEAVEALHAGRLTTPPAHTVLVVAEAGRLVVQPASALAYRPASDALSSTPMASNVFAAGERLEWQEHDAAGALAAYRPLADSTRPEVRAGALLRIARTQRQLGRLDDAAVTYAALTEMEDAAIGGYPASLLALSARCDVLHVLNQPGELRVAAAALDAGLRTGRWTLTRDAYAFYRAEADRWTPERVPDPDEASRLASAAAYASLHERWAAGAEVPARQWLVAEARPVLAATRTVLNRRITLLGDLDYLRSAWSDAADDQITLTDGEGRTLFGAAPDDSGMPQAVRATDATRLPWTVRVSSNASDREQASTAERRWLLFAGLGAVLTLIGGSTYLAARGLARELAAARLQSDFVAAVSHEFRTPLASVRHLSDLLASDRVPDDAQRRTCYHVLARESARLERLVEDLLDFGRMEHGAYALHRSACDIVAFVRSVVEDAAASDHTTTHRVDLACPDRVLMVRIDREALARAIRNLLDNAAKYSPGASTVWVVVEALDGRARVAIRDEGFGIPSEEQADIFRRFVRGRTALDHQIAGTGVGLAIVQHIVEAHGGTVMVQSQPGSGSTFTIELPLADASSAAETRHVA